MRLRRLFSRPSTPHPAAVLYTMGKVGSTSIEEALRAAGITTFKVHSLRPASLAHQVQGFVSRGKLPPPHMSIAMAYRDAFLSDPDSYRFLSGVRDPLARTLSAFFQTLQYRTDGLGPDSDPEVLFDTYLAETDQTYGLGGWFDHEFRDQMGIEVLEQPFDPGRRIGPLPDGRGLIFRSDCAPAVLEESIGGLFGCRVSIGQRNVGRQKDYAGAYGQVLAHARFPRDIIDRVYGSPFVRHFWTEDERMALAEGWADPALRAKRREMS